MNKAEDTQLYRIRHSLAHVLAQAVLEIRPEAKLGFGPPVENGFYYDFDLEDPLSPEDLPEIEKRMKKMVHAFCQNAQKHSIDKDFAFWPFEKSIGGYKFLLLNFHAGEG
ncbi:MAG: hypothetical protein QF457_10875, partial [SAR324 cluster bacterium]|nr:hypothetical protein [SAR324 cluster bacterium]